MNRAFVASLLLLTACGEGLPEVEVTTWDAIRCIVTDRADDLKDYTCTATVGLRTRNFDPDTRFARSGASLYSEVGAFENRGTMLIEESGPGFSGNQSLSITLESTGSVYDTTDCVSGTDATGEVHVEVDEDLGDEVYAFHTDTREVEVSVACQ